MAILRDSAVVLKRLDFSETSQVLAFFTREHGKVRAIAKGIKRGTKTRFATGIDLLDIGHVVFSSRQERSSSLATLSEWKQTRSLGGLREKLARLNGAQYVAEITALLTADWDPHPNMYQALIAALVELTAADQPLPAVVRYQLVLLDEVGSLPQFQVCVPCGRSEDLTYFSATEGGMVCASCQSRIVEKRQMSAATLDALQHTEPRKAADGMFATLNYHIAYQLGREPFLAAKLAPHARRRITE